MNVDWESDESHVFVNPRVLEADPSQLEPIKNRLKGHIFLTTSGTKSLKWAALSKQAFLASASAVNLHIEAAPKDIWVNALPYYHVAGLSIFARAYLAKTYVYHFDNKWNPKEWADFVEEKRASLTSLVPTQLWDLLADEIKPPSRLRVVVVGGQKLTDDLYIKAKQAGWPLMPTYGMTEMCSQIATASLSSPELKLLSHVQAKVSETGRLSLRSPALLSGYLLPEYHDPKVEGWFETDDLVEIKGTTLIPKGRVDDVIKINGELVNLFQLDSVLTAHKEKLGITADIALVPHPDPRSGYKLHLYHTPFNVRPLMESYNSDVAPFSRIHTSIEVREFPKTALGKIRFRF